MSSIDHLQAFKSTFWLVFHSTYGFFFTWKTLSICCMRKIKTLVSENFIIFALLDVVFNNKFIDFPSFFFLKKFPFYSTIFG
jgi:hypothetical protein